MAGNIAQCELVGIPADEAEQIWPTVKPYIERALAKGQGEYTPEDILRAIQRRDMQLWQGQGCVGVTQILAYPSGLKVVDILLTAGENLCEWLESSNETIYLWAKHIGADHVRVMGRPGWKKMLGHIGYEHAYTVMVRRVQ